MPIASVVIPCLAPGPSLRWCLQALSVQHFPRLDFEVLLVLDGAAAPPWSSFGIDAGFPLHIVRLHTKKGRAGSRNAGLSKASGQWTVFLDADMLAHPDLLSAYAAVQQRKGERTVCIGERRFVDPESCIDILSATDFERVSESRLMKADYRMRFYQRTNFLREAAEPFWAFSTCNVCVPTAAALSVGGFDENMREWGLEDTEFAFRLWRTGQYEFRLVPDAVAIHVEHTRDLLGQRMSYLRNRAYLIAKHGSLFEKC